MNLRTHPKMRSRLKAQHGASLIMVMIILTIVSMIGIAGIQISTMSERGARNDRDYQIAWQSSEAGLMDAENDLFGPGTSTRRGVFGPAINLAAFEAGCGALTVSRGLCASAPTAGKPAWVGVDFKVSGIGAKTAEYGEFTGRTFAAGGPGVQPARKPRYVMEPFPDNIGMGSESRNLGSDEESKYIFRVTSMGFGPRDDIQAVVQMIYRR